MQKKVDGENLLNYSKHVFEIFKSKAKIQIMLKKFLLYLIDVISNFSLDDFHLNFGQKLKCLSQTFHSKCFKIDLIERLSVKHEVTITEHLHYHKGFLLLQKKIKLKLKYNPQCLLYRKNIFLLFLKLNHLLYRFMCVNI